MKHLLSAALMALCLTLFALPTFAIETYTLTIHYQYEDGTTALDSFSGTFEQGESFEVSTPLIEGYVPTLHNIRGEIGNIDLTYTVIFRVIAKPEPPTSSSAPLPEVPEKPEPPHSNPSESIAEDSIFSSWGDDFLEKEDFVAFSEETLKDSEAMMKSSIGNIASIAAYGFIVVLAVFSVFEIIRGIAF